jgi:hypothetical protein
LNGKAPLVYIDGKPAIKDKDYVTAKGESYMVVKLTRDEAEKKYGKKTEDGILEITTVK